MGRKKKFTDEVLDELAKSLEAWVDSNIGKKDFVMLGDWCFQNGFNPKYFRNHIDKHQGFKEAYEWAKAWQEHCIAKGALKQTLNAKFAQFFLGCNHEWRTKEATDERISQLGNDFGKFIEYMNSQKMKKKEAEEEDC